MKFIKKINLILISLSLMFIPLKSVTCIYKEYNLSPKTIIVLGDQHLLSLNYNDQATRNQAMNLEKISSEILISWFKEIGSKNIKTNLILEGDPDFPFDNLDTIQTLSSVEKYFRSNFSYGNINAVFADNRTRIFRLLGHVHRVCFELTSNPQLEKLLLLSTRLQDEVKKTKREESEKEIGKKISVKEYLDHSGKIIETLNSKNLDLNIADKEKDYIDSKLKFINSDFIDIKSELDKYNPTIHLTDALIDLIIVNLVSSERARNFYLKFTNFVHNTVVEMNFLLHLFEKIKNYDQIIILVGGNHIGVIDDFIKIMGFTENLNNQAIGNKLTEYPNNIKMPISESRLIKLLNNSFNGNYNIQLETLISKQLSNINQTDSKTSNQNTNCANSGCNNINCTLKCSRCKKAYYCSRECQKNHWQSHRRNCG